MTKDMLPPSPAREGDTDAPRAAARSPDAHSSAAHSPAALDSLKQAMRRARHDNAERASVMSDLRAARLGRLELLLEALRPLIAQIPAEVDTFDVGLVPGATPRLFIDMIGFVEMGRDARQYRLLQDTRTGRVVLKESEDVDTVVEAVTDYVARRLLERDRALAADTPPPAGCGSRSPPGPAARPARAAAAAPASRPASRAPRGVRRFLAIAFSFLIDLLGSMTLFTALAMLAWYLWTRFHPAS